MGHKIPKCHSCGSDEYDDQAPQLARKVQA
jgi:hypothetical protein